VKEQLCVLWGDLEEQKSALARTDEPNTHISSSVESKSSPQPSSRKPGDQPLTDSDDEAEVKWRQGKRTKTIPLHSTALSERDPNVVAKLQQNTDMGTTSPIEIQVKNKAFTCCIKQYGAKVNENDPSLANAGNGKRWEREFGLFGTEIV
jgi:protection-of-telomeres protein 1